MNLHSIFVHFPIACFVLYSVLECVSFLRKSKEKQLSYTKIFMLITGIIFAFMSLQTGEIAEHLNGRSALIETHSQFANITYALYRIILVLYIISRELIGLQLKKYLNAIFITKLISIIAWIKKYGIMALLSFIAMISLSITGALWWAISHGPAADPVVSFVYSMIMK